MKLSRLLIFLYVLNIVILVMIFYRTPTIITTVENIYTSTPESLVVEITAYTNRKCETNKDNNRTAIMERPVVGGSCAVSRDLLHWLGGRIYIEGIGIRRVNDLMNERFTRRIDLFMGTVQEAQQFGKQQKQAVFLGRG